MKKKNEKRKHYDAMVSVIIPAYNVERYIRETVCSAIGQSYDNIEIIIVDDCSTDGTYAILKEISLEHERCRVYQNRKRLGAAKSRNKALSFAKGRYVAFLDSDDVWKKNKLEAQMSLMKREGIGFSFTAIEMIDERGAVTRCKRAVKGVVDYDFLLKNTMIPTSSVVIDREICGDFRMKNIYSGQDYATWLALLRRGFHAHGIDEALVQYRVRGNSLSSKKIKGAVQLYWIQVELERINPIVAMYNIFWYAVHAVRKYYFN